MYCSSDVRLLVQRLHEKRPGSVCPPVAGSSVQDADQIDAIRADGSTLYADDDTGLSGTWKWSVGSDESKLDMTLQLRLHRGTLLGTIEGSKAPRKAIENASFKDGEVAFSVSRNRKDGKVITKYNGKLEEDTIKGTAEVTQVDGKMSVRDWEAERDKSPIRVNSKGI